MGEVWNNVTVIGPVAEVERFKRLCLHPSKPDVRQGQSGWDGCACTIQTPLTDDALSANDNSVDLLESVMNFQQFEQDEGIEYSFSFDTYTGFPVRLFKQLAARFPRLAFDCSNIESMDEFMGYGWFNPPPGGESFAEEYAVPKNFWCGGRGYKRRPSAQKAHEASYKTLKEAAHLQPV